tara:strand:- start:16684 stop:17898 length:1215 start_codon:yes stop_codon:yes gene_type:complete
MASLQDLSLSLRRGAQSEANLAGLDEQYAQATDLYNTKTAVPTKYGQTSGLAVLNDLVGGIRGDNKRRALKPQREAARADVANSKFSLPLYQAKVQQDAADLAQKNVESKAEATLTAAGLKRTQEEADQAKKDATYKEEQGQIATAPVEYTDGKGNRVMLSRLKNGTWVDGNNNELDSIKGFSEVPKVNKNINLGGGYNDPQANKTALDDIKNLGAANRVIGLYNDLSPETLARISSPTKRIGDIIVKSVLPNNVSAFVKSEIEKDPQVEQYYSALSQMSAVERHAMFGGALTKFEAMSANDFLAFVIGLPPEEQISRVRNTMAKSKTSLDVADNFYNGTSFNDVLSSMNYGNLDFGAATPQEGSVNANALKIPAPANIDAVEWGSYSREAQQRYLESKGGTPK